MIDAAQKDELITTPGFSAPELWIYDGICNFDESVDSWSLGMIICSLLVPSIDDDICSLRPSSDATLDYRSARLTPEDMSLQLWIACSPNTITEFVSMVSAGSCVSSILFDLTLCP
jgi:serine/threonine protein kinase